MIRTTRRRAALLLFGALSALTVLAGVAPPASADRGQEAGDAEAGFTSLTLLNGWVPYGSGTSAPKVRVSNGIVEFKGAMGGGTLPAAFVLPAGMRPTRKVFIPVDLCSAANGRLVIKPDGTTRVEAESNFSDATCFTSLEGASFALAPAAQVALPLINGWTNGAAGTRSAAAAVVGGVVHLSGAIRTNGTSKNPFVIPVGMRPAATIFVPIDLCSASDGRLRIGSSGVVTVQTSGNFSDAQCFTSLDGATWVVNPTAQTPLALENGWTGQPYHTRVPRAGLVNGVVRLSGAIADGTGSEVFTLPPTLAPSRLVYIQVDLCGATNGRLVIDTHGVADVDSEGELGDAQCFTSLEGASFLR